MSKSTPWADVRSMADSGSLLLVHDEREFAWFAVKGVVLHSITFAQLLQPLEDGCKPAGSNWAAVIGRVSS